MAFFKNRYTKEGPGIDKNAPKKKGLALFFSILFREMWELIKLNLIFILSIFPSIIAMIFLVPLATYGGTVNMLFVLITGIVVMLFAAPAIGAMTFVMTKIVRDIPTYVWRDYWEGYKKNWKASLIAGAIGLGFILSALSSFYLWITGGSVIFFGLGMMVNLIGGLIFIYLYPMIVLIDLPFIAAFKNAIILGISCLKHSLPALIICEVLILASAIFLQFTFPLFILIIFSLICLIATFAAWAGIKKYVLKLDENGEIIENEEDVENSVSEETE